MSRPKTAAPFTALAATRRQFLARTAIGAAAVSVSAPFISRGWAAETLVVRDPGGPFTKAYAEAFYKPFTKDTGIEITQVTAPNDPVGLVKAQVDNKAYTWDAFILSLGDATSLGTKYLEELNLSGADVTEVLPEARSPVFLGTDTYSTIFACRTDTIKGAGPESWVDFWNVSKFPGRRALRQFPVDTIEEAIMAGGTDPKKLYPFTFEAAFKSLDQIKSHVDVWWTGGAQSSQLIKTGEVDMCATWNGRAQAAIDDGAPARIVWNGGLYAFEGFCIGKGNPKADLARKFIASCANAQRQAAYTNYLSYGPTNPNAYKHINPDKAQNLPTAPENIKGMVFQDSVFWGKNLDAALDKFNAWVLG